MIVLGVDPGQSDPFSVVLIEPKDGKIFIRGCKFWKNQDYNIVEKEIREICIKQKIDTVVVERNSVGVHVIENLVNLGVNVQYVTTTRLKDPLKKDDVHKMDKNEMVEWLIRQQQDGILVWPETTSEYMAELKRQWAIFGEYHKDKFEAPTGEHDDLVMALIMACYYIRNLDYHSITLTHDGRIIDYDRKRKSSINFIGC